MPTYFLLDPFEFPYYFYRILLSAGCRFLIYSAIYIYKFNSSAFKKTFMPNNTTTKLSHREHSNTRTSK